MKTSELTGAALDWAVAKCEGFGTDSYMRNIDMRYNVAGKASAMFVPINREYVRWNPSTDWSQGGPIIEQEKIILLAPNEFKSYWEAGTNYEYDWDVVGAQIGETALIAAMRCYVASKLGDNVEIPDELKEK